MLKINLTRTSYDRPACPASRRRTIDLSLLNRNAIGMLKNIISYRNSTTGKGFFWSGIPVAHKLKSGHRQFLCGEVEALLRYIKGAEGIPVNAQHIIGRVSKNIDKIEGDIKTEIKPGLDKTVYAIRQRYPYVATSETSNYAHTFTQELTRAIKPYEARTLEYLKLIDGEIDVLLSVFGLTRYWRI